VLLDSGFEYCILEANHTGDVLHEYIFLHKEVGSPSVSAQLNIASPCDATGFDDGKGNPKRDPGIYFGRSFLEAVQFGTLIILEDF